MRFWRRGTPSRGTWRNCLSRYSQRHLEEQQIPPGYHTERLRNAMLEDLENFANDQQWQRENYRSRMEEAFTFALADGLEIRGKIDRLDVTADGRAYVLDYKYSAAKNIKARKEDPPCCRRRCT